MASSIEVRKSQSAETAAYEPRKFELGHLQGLSPEAIALHLDLYKGYVKAVNELLAEEGAAPKRVASARMAASARSSSRFAFEWNGMVMHESFFEQFERRNDLPAPVDGRLASAATKSFGGLELWQADCLSLAETRGVGWVVCSFDARTGRLFNHWVELHHLSQTCGMAPVLVLDVWEHAYLLDFKPTQRADYFQCLWGQIDWSVVESRVAKAASRR